MCILSVFIMHLLSRCTIDKEYRVYVLIIYCVTSRNSSEQSKLKRYSHNTLDTKEEEDEEQGSNAMCSKRVSRTPICSERVTRSRTPMCSERVTRSRAPMCSERGTRSRTPMCSERVTRSRTPICVR